MQRPRSEERRSTRCQPSLVRRSLQFGASENRGSIQGADFNQPRRPNTTPKHRIQRLLPAPGHGPPLDWQSSRHSITPPPSTLTRLPDSPPRLHSSSSTPFSTTLKTLRSADDERPVLRASTKDKDASTSIFQFQSISKTLDKVSPLLKLVTESSNNKDDNTDKRCVGSLEPEKNEEEAQENGDEIIPSAEALGPLPTDIHTDSILRNQDTQPNLCDDDDDDNEYERELAERERLLNDEANRQRTRDELEAYVGTLSSRTDENGDRLLEFPRNYQQVVSLMTQKDIREEDSKAKDSNSRQSWSRVLIESGLSKQQAFGILDDAGEDTAENGGMAAKIALKMARIRQLDTILEEKLGKDIYANIAPRKAKRTTMSPQPESAGEAGNSSLSRTFVTQSQPTPAVATSSNGGESSRSSSSSSRLSTANIDTSSFIKDPGSKKSNYFIERNKQVVANGMKANMTREEEIRLEKLLQDEGTTAIGDSAIGGSPVDEENSQAGTGFSRDRNEFTMTDAEKHAIEELITTKSSAYPLFSIDEQQDGPTDDASPTCGDNSKDTRSGKDNILQETKRERLQRQRLSRVEQELRFLQESPSVVIVGDDNDGVENDDCRSENSFVTVASSTCSTRSGVISRQDFKCFLAQQKENFRSTPTASAEEIRQLLLSMPSSNSVVTATTG